MTRFRLLECLLIDNGCWKQYHNAEILPTGITVHSTDLAGSVLRRYVQPAAGQNFGLKDGDEEITADKMLQILGKNIYGNSWNRSGADVAPHAAIGKLADGTYAVCKTLDYTQPCWGAAFGPNGSYDGRVIVNGKKIPGGPLNVQFEMIEDGSAGNKEHCQMMYALAVEFCVYLCKLFPSIQIENIISHKEAHARGRGSAHGDPESYWKRCGTSYTMDGFRADVRKRLEQEEEINMTKQELDELLKQTKDDAKQEALAELRKEFTELWQKNYLAEMDSLSDNASGGWSEDARKWAVDNGIIKGVGQLPDGAPNYAWRMPLTREMYVTTEYRQHLAEEAESEG